MDQKKNPNPHLKLESMEKIMREKDNRLSGLPRDINGEILKFILDSVVTNINPTTVEDICNNDFYKYNICNNENFWKLLWSKNISKHLPTSDKFMSHIKELSKDTTYSDMNVIEDIKKMIKIYKNNQNELEYVKNIYMYIYSKLMSENTFNSRPLHLELWEKVKSNNWTILSTILRMINKNHSDEMILKYIKFYVAHNRINFNIPGVYEYYYEIEKRIRVKERMPFSSINVSNTSDKNLVSDILIGLMKKDVDKNHFAIDKLIELGINLNELYKRSLTYYFFPKINFMGYIIINIDPSNIIETLEYFYKYNLNADLVAIDSETDIKYNAFELLEYITNTENNAYEDDGYEEIKDKIYQQKNLQYLRDVYQL